MVTSNDIHNPAGRSGLELPKSPTGITGFDEVSHGGLPTGRPTLVSGRPARARACSRCSSWSTVPPSAPSRESS
jgi:hypothetical protein